MANDKAFELIERRFSDQIKLFNHYDVSTTDSDDHFWFVKDRIELARVALDRAPEMRVTTLARSLGDIYREVRKNLTPDELKKWEELGGKLEALNDKYGI